VQPGHEDLGGKLSSAIYENLGFHATITTVPVGTIERPPGKAVRIVDNRK
jgi:phenylacetate-CoA ligase